MTEPVFVDSNVLVYRRDASDPRKQARAETWVRRLWEERLGRLSTQVLQEFYVTVTRTLRPGLPADAAREEIRDLFAWKPVTPSSAIIEGAWTIESRHGLSFWDALIAAAAKASSCGYLLSEDLQDGLDLDGVRVINPFAHEPDEIGL